MPTSTYSWISSANVSSGSVNSVTFGSGGTLTQAYTDLIFIVNGGGSQPADIGARFNGDTGNNYTFQSMATTGSGIGGSRYTAGSEMSWTTNSYHRTGFKNASMHYVFNYTNPNIYKVALNRATYDGAAMDCITSTWKSNSAITSVTLYMTNSATWTADTTINLYGILAA